jgi:hypothetical protein
VTSVCALSFGCAKLMAGVTAMAIAAASKNFLMVVS